MSMKSKRSSDKATNQVRIIGGVHKRRLLSFIDADGLRPTPDRLRETVFNWLMGSLQDALVLDVCAGSGVLGFECISRGAHQAVLIEKNSAQAKQLTANAKLLHIDDKVRIIAGDATTVLATLDTPFDIIFIDPPYVAMLWQPLIDILLNKQLIHADTLIYLEADQLIDGVLTADTLRQFNMIKYTKVGQAHAYLLAPITA